jgi:glycine/D-amino acid oxidase-like deaminating enzyme
MATISSTGHAPADASGIKHSIYWRDTEAVVPGPPLAGDVRCDVGIIGGGYTGLWTAYFLKQADPSLDIHIVEMDYAGAGASGHADGFVTPTIGHSLAGLVHGFGTERAKTAYSVVGRSMLELDRFCRKHDVDAELESTGYFSVAASEAQLRLLRRDVELAERIGAKNSLRLLGPAEARERIGSPAIHGAFKVGGALLNPHRLARGLARVVRGLGVHIHERTTATSVTKESGRHVITTPGGRVIANKLVLGTDAYQHQFTTFKHRVKPVWSYAVVTEPLTDEQLAQVHWPDREGFVESRNFIIFGRFTKDNRLLFGGGPAPYYYGRDMAEDRYMRRDSSTAFLRDALVRYFPAWKDVRIAYSYGGCVGMTRDFVPHVGNTDDDVYYAYGYCGNGIALTHTAGKILRDLILGRDSAYSNLLFVNRKERRFPVEPVSWVGARALTALLSFQDRHPNLIKKQLV